MFWSTRIERALASEVEFLRKKLGEEQDRCNRLIEALAQISNVKIVMPQQSQEEKILRVQNFAREQSSGYFDTIRPAPPKPPGGN